MNNHHQFVRKRSATKSTRQVMGQRKAYPSPKKGNRLLTLLVMKRKIMMQRRERIERELRKRGRRGGGR